MEASLPVRERGLKRRIEALSLEPRTSLPVRERGLKLFYGLDELYEARVAPRAGAWIETPCLRCVFWSFASLPVRERGLKQRSSLGELDQCLSLPVRERGLKQTIHREDAVSEHVAPRAGAWIETLCVLACSLLAEVAPRAGAWIETFWGL